MTIYEEALVDAKKLKEVAEFEAKNAILEAIAPHIKRMIGKEVAGLSSPLFEEDDPTAMTGDLPSDLPVSADAGAMGAAASPVSLPSAVSGTDDAPIKPSGEEMMNMPLPGPDGKLIVDFEDLFTPTDDTAQEVPDESPASAETMPAAGAEGELTPPGLPVPPSSAGEAVPPESAPSPVGNVMQTPVVGGLPGEENKEEEMPEALSYEAFKEGIDTLALRIDKAFWKPSVPSLVKEALQERLFEAYEKLEKLSESGKISSRLAKLSENRLEFLHMKLKEASVGTNYQRTEKGKDMKSLKEFASKLFEDTLEGGENTSPADSFEDKGTLKVDNAQNEKTADKAADHAKKLTEPTVTLKTEAKDDEDMDEGKMYEAEMKKLEEELKEVLSAEDGLQDLAGAASSIPDKKVGDVDTTKQSAAGPSTPSAKVQGVKKESKDDADDLDEWIEHDKASGSEKDVGPVSEKKKSAVDEEILEVKDEELAEAVRSIKKENIKRRIRALKEALVECEMEDEMSMPSMPHMEDEAMMGGVPGAMGGGKPPMADEGGTVVNFNFDLDDLGMGDMGDDDEIEIVDDEPGSEEGGMGDMDMMGGASGEEEPAVGGHGEEGEEGEELEASGLPAPGLHMESRKRNMAKAKKLAEAKSSKEVTALRAQLTESQLWNAKVLYLNKFLYKEDLSRQQKQKIAEYLDKAKTLEEAKTIYGRVKKLLEGASSKRKAGSSSKVTSKGSSTNSLRESVASDDAKANLFEGAALVEPERNRLMELAGIKKRS